LISKRSEVIAMNARMGKALLALFVMGLAGCAATPETKERAAPEPMSLTLNEQDVQYMCASPVYLSDVTKSFVLPLGSNDRTVAMGDLLNQAVQKMFWKETKAGNAVAPVVTAGFDGGTGAYRDSTLYVRISLQFQIFKPTGQSYMDVAVGESSSKTAPDSSDGAVVNAALQQALGRLAGVLSSAGICRPMH